MIIELIRHGETALQAEQRYQGRTDAPLSQKGRAALRPAGYVPELLCVTTLLRSRESAEILFPGVPVTVVPGLEEMDFGIFEGRNYSEMENDPAYRLWVDGMCEGPCPGGESKAAFCDRVNEAFSKLVRKAFERGIGMLTVVAHGGTVMSVLERFCTEDRGYYDWHTGSGKGYLVRCVSLDPQPVLELLKETDHTGR